MWKRTKKLRAIREYKRLVRRRTRQFKRALKALGANPKSDEWIVWYGTTSQVRNAVLDATGALLRVVFQVDDHDNHGHFRIGVLLKKIDIAAVDALLELRGGRVPPNNSTKIHDPRLAYWPAPFGSELRHPFRSQPPDLQALVRRYHPKLIRDWLLSLPLSQRGPTAFPEDRQRARRLFGHLNEGDRMQAQLESIARPYSIGGRVKGRRAEEIFIDELLDETVTIDAVEFLSEV